MVESALYYTYFRTHLSELATLVRDSEYYVSRAEVLSYHKAHTPGFRQLQEKLGFMARLNAWYGNVSAIVHGQIPGIWTTHKALSDIRYSPKTLELLVADFCRGEQLVHELFLLTIGREMWDSISTGAKRALLTGMSAEERALLGLDQR